MMKKIYLPAIFFLIGTAVSAQKTQKDITQEDIWLKGTFGSEYVYGFNPMKDGKTYTRLEFSQPAEESYIIRYDYASGNVLDTLFRGGDISALKSKYIEGYAFSEDESKLLISVETEAIYRHSARTRDFVFDIRSKRNWQVSDEKQMYATFSPDGSQVAYVKDNNLFVKNYTTGNLLQVTADGERNKIINGGVDWVYEEEFTMSQGFQWSPDGKRIAFYRFDESGVKEFSMDIYGTLYPQQEVFKYPKAGEANSLVTIKIYDVVSGKTVNVEVGQETDQYLPRIRWTRDAAVLSVQRLNRLQNKWELLLADAATGTSKVILTENNKYYIDITDDLYFLENGKEFIISSEKNGYKHLYLHDITGKEALQLTSGQYDIADFLGFDEPNKMLYFTTGAEKVTEKQLFRWRLYSKAMPQQLTQEAGWHSVQFNPSFTYYMDNFSTANTPAVFSIRKSNGSLVRTLKDNGKLKSRMAEYNFSPAEFGTLTTDSGISLNYWMIKPKDFDPSKKYPLLMYVYGGPGHQTVLNQWMGANYNWYQLLAGKGYIVVSVDNRGTGARGEEFKKCTYLNLGKLEIEDQIGAARYFGRQSYINAGRIGIWGWSFGGYMASLGISKGADVFKAAIAVAPVTNWRYYDNIYTERFMRTPQENGKNYDDNSPISHVDKIKGSYLIIHGTADDNVHFQNAVEMVNRMIEKGVAFDSEFYPDKNHGIGGAKTRLHLYKRMTNFILENL